MLSYPVVAVIARAWGITSAVTGAAAHGRVCRGAVVPARSAVVVVGQLALAFACGAEPASKRIAAPYQPYRCVARNSSTMISGITQKVVSRRASW